MFPQNSISNPSYPTRQNLIILNKDVPNAHSHRPQLPSTPDSNKPDHNTIIDSIVDFAEYAILKELDNPTLPQTYLILFLLPLIFDS